MGERDKFKIDVDHFSTETKSEDYKSVIGACEHEVIFRVKGSYKILDHMTPSEIEAVRVKMQLAMKRKSCDVLSKMKIAVEDNMKVLRRERLELMRINALEYRQRLRRRR